MKIQRSSFFELPKGIQKRIIDIHPNDYLTFVTEPIPALEDRSVMDLYRNKHLSLIYDYLSKIEGYLGK